MRNHKYKTTFASEAKFKIDKKNKIIASLDSLKALLPDNNGNQSLLPIAANATVVNYGNKNNHLIDTPVALSIAKKFVHVGINVEHEPSVLCGHIANFAFTRFDLNYTTGAGSEIIETPSSDDFTPFNIALGGFIYAELYPKLTQKIIDSAIDKESEDYLSVNYSWEIGFSRVNIMVGSRYRSEAEEIITDPDECEKLFESIKNGKRQKDGKDIYALVVFDKDENGKDIEDSVEPLGIGLVLQAGGHVKGLVVPDFENNSNEITANTQKNNEIQENIEKSSIKSSQLKNKSVKTNIKSMKLFKSLAELAKADDESIKEYSIANVEGLIEKELEAERKKVKADLQTEIADACKEWEVKVNAEKAQASEIKAKADEATAKVIELEASLKEVRASLEKLATEKEASDKQQVFSARMSFLDETYELNDDDRKVFAKRVTKLGDEADFEDFKSEIAITLRDKSKASIAAAKAEAEKNDKSKGKIKASETANDLLDKGKVEKASLPNKVEGDENETEKLRKGWGEDAFEISYAR